jgi:hypothetical protein
MLRIAPTNKYKRKTARIEDYQFKAAEFPGKCQGGIRSFNLCFSPGQSRCTDRRNRRYRYKT